MTSLNDAFVLPPDVKLVPVEEYPEKTRSQFSHESGDVAITRVRSRTPTKIVDAGLAALLEQFTSGKTVVEAVLYHSLRESLNPRDLLNEAFPFILQMVGERLLIPVGEMSEDAVSILRRDDYIDDYRVVRPLKSLADTELYQVRDKNGAYCALKLAKPQESAHIARVLRHEATVLQFLNGSVAPNLISQGTFENQPYLAIEWRSGADVGAVAADLRSSLRPSAIADLLKLCNAVLAAYTTLHNNQVIHGDVHHGNILVDMDDRVHLIDFGLARVLDESASLYDPLPGGVPFFAAPETCKAALEKRSVPPANALSEQYALAALLYHLFTGAHYLDFSLEEEVMWRQIVEDAPLPFQDQAVAPWPKVEAILNKALSKDPQARFATVAEFAKALGGAVVIQNTVASDSINPVIIDRRAERLVSDVLERIGLQGSLLAKGNLKPPTASIHYGAAGVAYFLYRASCTRNDPKMLALADIWANLAQQLAAGEDGFQSAELDITPETVPGIAPLHSPTGLHILHFLLAQAAGDEVMQAQALTAFVQTADQDCGELDLTLGKSSVLLHGAYLYELLPEKQWATGSGLLSLGNSLLDQIWQEVDAYAPIRWSSELSNLGIAHGWAGILFAIIKWCRIVGTPLPSAVEERLKQLAGCAEYVGRGSEMPWDLKFPTPSTMPGWCNGSAGHLFLWTTAYRTYNEEQYLNLAIRSGWNVWEAPRTSVNLCCGLAGRAYALVNLYKTTGDKIWLDRARELGRQAALSARHPQTGDFEGFENSLYKGDVGVAALLVDLEEPDLAAMPFFESIA